MKNCTAVVRWCGAVRRGGERSTAPSSSPWTSTSGLVDNNLHYEPSPCTRLSRRPSPSLGVSIAAIITLQHACRSPFATGLVHHCDHSTQCTFHPVLHSPQSPSARLPYYAYYTAPLYPPPSSPTHTPTHRFRKSLMCGELTYTNTPYRSTISKQRYRRPRCFTHEMRRNHPVLPAAVTRPSPTRRTPTLRRPTLHSTITSPPQTLQVS